MKLQYRDLLGNGEMRHVEAEVTADHPSSHYGQPVIVLPDGDALDLQSWVLLGYQVLQADADEIEALKKIFSNFGLMCGDASFAARELGAKGGAIKSEAKSNAAKKNGKKGGRPKKTEAK